MSATQLAAFVVAAALSVIVVGLAALLIARDYRATRGSLHGGTVVFVLALGCLVVGILWVGVSMSTPNTPQGPRLSSRCEPGTYDNGGAPYNGPVCIPWSNGGQR